MLLAYMELVQPHGVSHSQHSHVRGKSRVGSSNASKSRFVFETSSVYLRLACGRQNEAERSNGVWLGCQFRNGRPVFNTLLCSHIANSR